MGVIVAGGTVFHRPYAPTLQLPISGSFLDLAGSPQFVWQYNQGQIGQTQQFWLFERRTNNGRTASYWNLTTGLWQSTAVWNDSTPIGTPGDPNSNSYPAVLQFAGRSRMASRLAEKPVE